MKEENTVVEGIKLALSIVGGLGISFLCGAFLGNIARQCSAGPVKKACMAVGGVILGGMIAQEADEFVSHQVDAVVDTIEWIKKMANKDPKTANEDAR